MRWGRQVRGEEVGGGASHGQWSVRSRFFLVENLKIEKLGDFLINFDFL